jgi:hypothetical protein
MLGMEIFAQRLKFDTTTGLPSADGTSPRENFDDFYHAFITIFLTLVGDDWQFIYFNAVRAEGHISSVFFISLIVFGNFILLNLFLAILLGNFGVVEIDEEKL